MAQQGVRLVEYDLKKSMTILLAKLAHKISGLDCGEL